MSRVGLDWYKREPVAYLGDVQGLSSKEHAVYSVLIDLLYVHGGEIRNDPKWISGWISDMGTASVRKVIAALEANPRVTITVTETEISQKRAKNEVKTKQKQRETAQESGSKGGKKSAELRAVLNENNNLDEADAETGIQPEKRREEKKEKHTKRFDEFWVLYPKKAGKKAAEKSYERALKSVGHSQLMDGLRQYVTFRKVKEGYILNPATWLNGGHWDDEEDPTPNGPNGSPSKADMYRSMT